MTITPTAPTIGPAPAALPTGDPGAATDGTVPGDFLALVQKALADALGGAPDSASGTTPGGTTVAGPGIPGAPAGAGAAPADPTAEATPGAQADPAAAATAAAAAAAAGLTALVVPVLPATAGAAATPATAGPAAGPVGAVGAGAATDSSTAAGAPAAAADAHATGTATRASGHPGTSTPAAGSADTGTDATGVPDAPVAAAGPGHGSHGSGEAADGGAGRQSAVPTPAAVAPATVTGAPTTTPTAPATGASAAPPVSGQVFPEVTSLVSRGDGVHRITLTLKPEALGEVRVVMTVRDGAVHVRLAAGHEAQQALLQGSPELSRLLEHAGATDAHIVVRDLFGAAAPTSGTSTNTSDHGTDLGQGQGLDAGGSRSQDQHAGTRAEHDATDGPITGGATLPRSAQSVTRTRTSGVDVTM